MVNDMDYLNRLSQYIAGCCQELDDTKEKFMPRDLYHKLNKVIYDRAAQGYLDNGKPCGRSVCYSFCGSVDVIADTIYTERNGYWDQLYKLIQKRIDQSL